ncbi:MAG: hypothetical protein ACHQ9S_17990 [Candidatus Binatia bacterium]
MNAGWWSRLRWAVAAATLATALLMGFPGRAPASPLVLTPQVSVSEQYNDNLFFDDRHIEDFVTSISEGLSLMYQRPRLTVSLSSGNSSQLYAHQTQQNSATSGQNGTLTMSYRASERLSLDLADTMTRVDRTRTGSTPQNSSPLPPAGVQPPGPETQASTLNSRGRALSNFFTGRASYLLAPRWTGGVTYGNTLNDFTDPGGSDLTNSAGLSLGYLWRPTTSVSANYSYARFNIKGAPNTESHNPSLGFSHQFDPTWSLSASAGVFVNRALEFGGGSVSTRTGPSYNAAVTKLFEHGSLAAGGGQQITSSGGVAGASETRSAFLGYQAWLLERVSGSLNGTYGHFDTNQTTYQFVTATTGLSVAFWRYFVGGISYSYRWNDNTQATATTTRGVVDGNLVQLYVSASYPVWRGDL